MLLADLARTSAAVAATRSRLEKRALLADLLVSAPPTEIDLAATYLSGTLRQRRTGVGWRSLAELPEPAVAPSLSLTEIDQRLTAVSELAGPGSGGERKVQVEALFATLAADEQAYLCALITGGIRQGALDSVMLDAIAVAADVPLAAVRRAAMFSAPTGPIAVAALTGGVEALAEFTLVVGRPVRPMLASSAPGVPEGFAPLAGAGAVVVDTKLDGIRIQAHKDGDDVLVFTRSLDEISDRLPGVVQAVRALAATSLILDGEALLVEADGRPRPFQETASETASSGGVSAQPFFFDLLAHDGESLIESPGTLRWERLDELVPESMRTRRLVTTEVDEATAFFASVVGDGQEGVILKDPTAPYAAGRRGAAWVKVKPRHTLDLVVLAVEHGSGRRRGTLSNIHLGARDGQGFVMLGKTFKGMTDEMLAWQTERFRALQVEDDGYVVTVRPEQVVEIAFDGVQRSTRYPGGVALRFARVLRYRDDKAPGDVDTLDAVRTFLARG
ncbi:ATP-dependent DNA ligase [Nocardioides marmoriginsengisoli]|uniref:DNA ligase B n=1 Tax=Nocardioides marmoriginsengisoli TaxID=661483 RepID=A0A3N0CNF5_9ACTN|nr:ATP-dependent DNA ligase [Nocardioides marmoriginsengisoli]RNL64831.1 ATP-dependent DNA ligase [Nocardioides marmoriginsengisoli]